MNGQRPSEDSADNLVTSGHVETTHLEARHVETGDIVIDAALRDLSQVPQGDLDAHIEAAESLQRTLQGRLANLGE